MNYETTSRNVTVKKDNRNLIYGGLIAALIITWGYMFYDKSKSTETVQQLQGQVSTSDKNREALQAEYNIASAKVDSLLSNNIQLQGTLAERNSEVQKIKGNIASILKNKNATVAQLREAKAMIEELNGKVTAMYAEVEKLKAENGQLTASNTQLTTEKTQLTSDKEVLQTNLTKTSEEKARVEDVASTLKASNISITPINIKNSGKEVSTTVAKRVDVMRVSFDVDENRITPTGKKDLYVAVIDPSGNIITLGDEITTREEGNKKVTSKVIVDYEQGKRSSVSFDWKPEADAKYQAGDYKIEIYQNGYKIGETVKTLKKGRLFS